MKVFIGFVLALVAIAFSGNVLVKGAPADNLIIGKFQLDSPTNAPDYAEFLEALKVSDQYRQVLTKMPINLEISKNDDGSYKYKVITPFVTRELSFHLGSQVEDHYVDGRKYKSVFNVAADNQILQKMTFDDVEAINEFVFTMETLTVTLMVGNKRAVRIYKRVEEFQPLKGKAH